MDSASYQGVSLLLTQTVWAQYQYKYQGLLLFANTNKLT